MCTHSQASPATHGTVSDKKVMVTGSVTVIASYDAKPGQLNLNILGANNLATPHSSGQLNPYVNLFVLFLLLFSVNLL